MEVDTAHIQVRREKKNIKMLNRFSVQKCFHFIFLSIYFYLTLFFYSASGKLAFHLTSLTDSRQPPRPRSIPSMLCVPVVARRLSLPAGPTPATVKTFVRGFAATWLRASVCERAFSSGLIVGSRHGALLVVACKPSVVRRLYLLHLNLPVLLSLCSTRLARRAATHVD